MAQNRDNDKYMPQRVAPSANIVNPAPLGVRMSSMVQVRVIEFYF